MNRSDRVPFKDLHEGMMNRARFEDCADEPIPEQDLMEKTRARYGTDFELIERIAWPPVSEQEKRYVERETIQLSNKKT